MIAPRLVGRQHMYWHVNGKGDGGAFLREVALAEISKPVGCEREAVGKSVPISMPTPSPTGRSYPLLSGRRPSSSQQFTVQKREFRRTSIKLLEEESVRTRTGCPSHLKVVNAIGPSNWVLRQLSRVAIKWWCLQLKQSSREKIPGSQRARFSTGIARPRYSTMFLWSSLEAQIFEYLTMVDHVFNA